MLVRRNRLGAKTWDLLDPFGEPVAAFREFCKRIEGLAFASRKRYAEVVAALIDYLFQAAVFGPTGDELPTPEYVNEVLDAYPRLLVLGSEELVRRIRANPNDETDETWLIDIAVALRRRPYKAASLSNTLSAINKFLRLSESLAVNAREAAKRRGISFAIEDYEPLIQAVRGSQAFTSFERKSISQNSMLGGVIRHRNEPLTRPRGLSVAEELSGPITRPVKDFPLDQVQALVDAATCWRDRALWLLLIASGIRQSEARNLIWADVVWEDRAVYVDDPRYLRMGRMMTDGEKLRFKGRTVSWTYMFEPFRTMFFEALLEYKRHEYILPAEGSLENDFVFQVLQSTRRGQPLQSATDTALIGSLHRAIRRAGIPAHHTCPGDPWDLHSFRHAYGMYMLNEALLTEDDGTVRHLTEAEVQVLMGHVDINSTRKYARRRDAALKRRLEATDKLLLRIGHINVAHLMAAPLARRLTSAVNHRGAVIH